MLAHATKLIAAVICGVLIFPVASTGQTKQHRLNDFKKKFQEAKVYGPSFTEGIEEGSDVIFDAVLSEGATAQQSASQFIDNIKSLLTTAPGELVVKVQKDGSTVSRLAYDPETESHMCATMRFEQYFEGIPVYRSGVGVLMKNNDLNELIYANSNLKDLSGFAIDEVPVAEVTHAMEQFAIQRIVREDGNRVALIGDLHHENASTVVWAGNTKNSKPRLALSFDAALEMNDGRLPTQRFHFVSDFASGKVLYAERRTNDRCFRGRRQARPVQFAELIERLPIPLLDKYRAGESAEQKNDSNSPLAGSVVIGLVQGWASDGEGNILCGTPEGLFRLPNAEVEIEGFGIENTSEGGFFSFQNVNTTPVTIRSRLASDEFVVVDSNTGSVVELPPQVVSPPSFVTLTHNPDPMNTCMGSGCKTAEVNAYLFANIFRDFILEYDDSFFSSASSDPQVTLITGLSSGCGGGYSSGSNPSISISVTGGGCRDGSALDVIAHEYGHHLLQIWGSNNSGAVSEGLNDCIGMLIEDEPILWRGYRVAGDQACETGLRNAENALCFPCAYSVGGLGHACAELISGCVWDFRNELFNSDPGTYRAVSSRMFVTALRMHCDSTAPINVNPSFSAVYLALDQAIYNGDHEAEIVAAFDMHNMLATATIPAEVVAESFSIVRGNQVNGGLGDTHASDDSYLEFQPGFTIGNEPPVSVVFESTLHCTNPGFGLNLETGSTTVNLRQTIEMYNWRDEQYEVVECPGMAGCGTIDVTSLLDVTTVFDLRINGKFNPAFDKFVEEETECVRARVSWERIPNTFILGYPWTVRVDKIGWTIDID